MGRSFGLLSEGRESPGQHPKPQEHSLMVSRLGYSECFHGRAFAFAYKKDQLAELRCSNCTNMKCMHEAEVQWCQAGATLSDLKQMLPSVLQFADLLNCLDLCFALHEGRRTSVISVRRFLSERIVKYNFHFERMLFMEKPRICTSFCAFRELTTWL